VPLHRGRETQAPLLPAFGSHRDFENGQGPPADEGGATRSAAVARVREIFDHRPPAGAKRTTFEGETSRRSRSDHCDRCHF